MWEMQALSTTNQNGDNNDLLSGASDPNDDQDSCSNHFVNDCDMPATAGTPTVAAGQAPNHHHSSLAMDESQCGTTKTTTNSIHQQHTSHPHLQQQQQQQHHQQQIHHQHHHIGNGELFAANQCRLPIEM
jgi:anthranilate/para-aminobenzoate synthase component I